MSFFSNLEIERQQKEQAEKEEQERIAAEEAEKERQAELARQAEEQGTNDKFQMFNEN